MNQAPSASPNQTASQVELNPGWFKSLRGLWSFTWRSRLTFKRLFGILLLMAAIPSLIYFVLPEGQTRGFMRLTIGLHMNLVVPLYCLVVFGALIRDELQNDTVGFIITRPISRAKFVILKFLCVALWAQLIMAVMGGIFVGVGFLKGMGDLEPLIPNFFWAQATAIMAYGAIGLVIGMISKNYIVIGVGYGFVVEIGIGSIPTNINALAMSNHIKTILAQNEMVLKFFKWPAEGLEMAAAIPFIVMFLCLAVAAVMFTLREYHHSDEMQK